MVALNISAPNATVKPFMGKEIEYIKYKNIQTIEQQCRSLFTN
jgi:hypothetical protein